MFRHFVPAEPKRKWASGPGPKPGRDGVRRRRCRNCPICLNRVTIRGRNAQRCTNKCNNYFHKECLANWKHVSNECPMCRQPIDNEPDSDSGSDSDEEALEPAPATGGLARFPSYGDNNEESTAFWSARGYHWNDNDQNWVSDQGRRPAQEDPVEYYLERDDIELDQFEDDDGENAEYWQDNGFSFDPFYGAWLFDHGELQGRLPSQVSAYWEDLDDPLEVHCCECERSDSFPLKLQDAIEHNWWQYEGGWYCPDHIDVGLARERGEEVFVIKCRVCHREEWFANESGAQDAAWDILHELCPEHA